MVAPDGFGEFAGRRATPEQHLQESDSLRAAAERNLVTGDLALASEAYWGVVAHALQAIAERSGMKHDSNLDFRTIKDWLVNETKNDEIENWYRQTYWLHRNFYRITLTRTEIETWSPCALNIADAARPFT